jgi:hypothetical protein
MRQIRLEDCTKAAEVKLWNVLFAFLIEIMTVLLAAKPTSAGNAS